LLDIVSPKIPSLNLQKYFVVGPSTIERSNKLENNQILSLKYPINVTRNCSSDKQLEIVKNVWINTCKQSSTQTTVLKRKSSKNDNQIICPVHWQTKNDDEIYQEYLNESKINKIQEFNKTKFISLRRDGLCSHCKDGRSAELGLFTLLNIIHKDCSSCRRDSECPKILTENQIKSIKDYNIKIEKYLKHKTTFQKQDLSYKNNIANLSTDECLIVQDFSSKIHTTQTINETQQEWFERECE